MKRLFVILIIFLFNTAFALDIVYPNKSKCSLNSKSTFFVGNVGIGKQLTINSKPVKIWYGNIFVEPVSLKDGENTFVLSSDGETRTYTITKPAKPKASGFHKSSEYREFPDNAILYTKTKDIRTPVREKPSGNAKRICDLPKDTVLYSVGKKSGFYKLYTADKRELWVSETSLDKKHFSFLSKITMSDIFYHRIYSDDYYDYIELNLSMPVLYVAESEGNNIKLTLFGLKWNQSLDKIVFKQKSFPDLTVRQEGSNLVFYIKSDKSNWGYLAGYKGDKFTFKMRKAPEKDKNLTLANVNIFVDPGHGGAQLGAVGPTRVCEKDINLQIAYKLAAILKQKGANVVMSRTGDTDLGLYERVDMANENKAHIFVSIHANSLPDSQNPYEKHGTSVYYYNEGAKELAEIIGKNLVYDTGLRNDGVNIGNFAVVRTTMPIAVLVETAYMIYPPEYIQLQNNAFQRLIARSIANSIEMYVLSKE